MTEPVDAPIATPLPAHIPYVSILASVTAGVIAGFAAVTYLVLAGDAGSGIDGATKGALIQQWGGMAMLAVGFWLGSSVTGKLKGGQP
jgi:hypothetical protein